MHLGFDSTQRYPKELKAVHWVLISALKLTDSINELEAAIGQIHQSAKGKHPNIILGGDFN